MDIKTQIRVSLAEFLNDVKNNNTSVVKISEDNQTEMAGSIMNPTTTLLFTAFELDTGNLYAYQRIERSNRSPAYSSDRINTFIQYFLLHGYFAVEGSWDVPTIKSLLEIK